MATQAFFADFFEQLASGHHDFTADTIKLFLSNTAPTAATDATLANITEISSANIAEGGNQIVTVSLSDANPSVLSADSITVTASGGAVATFQYYGLYNDDTVAAPIDALICYWDHGSGVTLADGESFEIQFNGSATAGTILSITSA